MNPIRPFQNPAYDQELANMRRPWLITGILPDTGLVILASPPKSGKTCFATAMALSLARGEPFLGRQVRQTPVLWCSYEENRWERKLLHDNITDETPYYVAYREDLPPIDDFQEFQRIVVDTAAKIKARLIVIDSLHAAVRRTNLTENGAARRVMQNLKDINFETSVTILVLHHVTKSATRAATSERFADSAQILATATTQLLLEVVRTSSPRRFNIHGQGRFPVPDHEIQVESTGLLVYRTPEINTQTIRESNQDRVASALNDLGEANAQQIAQHLGLSVGSVRNALTQLVRSNLAQTVSTRAETARYITSVCE